MTIKLKNAADTLHTLIEGLSESLQFDLFSDMFSLRVNLFQVKEEG